MEQFDTQIDRDGSNPIYSFQKNSTYDNKNSMSQTFGKGRGQNIPHELHGGCSMRGVKCSLLQNAWFHVLIHILFPRFVNIGYRHFVSWKYWFYLL